MRTRAQLTPGVVDLTEHPPPSASRAALRPVLPCIDHWCRRCGQVVRFNRAGRPLQVVCNVYADGVWSHVEVFHPDCYRDGGEPHGLAADWTGDWPLR